MKSSLFRVPFGEFVPNVVSFAKRVVSFLIVLAECYSSIDAPPLPRGVLETSPQYSCWKTFLLILVFVDNGIVAADATIGLVLHEINEVFCCKPGSDVFHVAARKTV